MAEGAGVYGLVNQGIRDMVLEAGGEPLWTEVRLKAGVEHEEFLSMQAYDDAVTMGLVGAASQVLDTPADELLKGFGRHWIDFTTKTGYGPLMDVSGETLPEFLSNLDRMHSRIKNSMPALDPPSFACERIDESTLEIGYYSSRTGLVPMVIGLIEGLANKFDQPAEIVHKQAKSSLDEPDLIEVRLLARLAD